MELVSLLVISLWSALTILTCEHLDVKAEETD
jgi:hypothetical protein